jgi:hypothetical protein
MLFYSVLYHRKIHFKRAKREFYENLQFPCRRAALPGAVGRFESVRVLIRHAGKPDARALRLVPGEERVELHTSVRAQKGGAPKDSGRRLQFMR